ncbi:MAG: helix-turn-helix transcriptional regulator [Vicinamibacterales bacterium]
MLELVRRGLRNREIAGSLGISEETVQSHVRSILNKLDVPDWYGGGRRRAAPRHPASALTARRSPTPLRDWREHARGKPSPPKIRRVPASSDASLDGHR